MLWFGVQLIWGAVLGISLQARCTQLAGGSSLITFAIISASGAFAAAITQLVVGPLSDVCVAGTRSQRILRRRCDSRTRWRFSRFTRAPSVERAAGVVRRAADLAQRHHRSVSGDHSRYDCRRSASALHPRGLPRLGSAGNACGAVSSEPCWARRYTRRGARACGRTARCGLDHDLYSRRLPMQPLPPRPICGDPHAGRSVHLASFGLSGLLHDPRIISISSSRRSYRTVLRWTRRGERAIHSDLYRRRSARARCFAARPADRIDERLVVSVGGGWWRFVHGSSADHVMGVLAPRDRRVRASGGVYFSARTGPLRAVCFRPAALATTMAIWNLAVVGPQMLAPLVASRNYFRAWVTLRNAMRSARRAALGRGRNAHRNALDLAFTAGPEGGIGSMALTAWNPCWRPCVLRLVGQISCPPQYSK